MSAATNGTERIETLVIGGGQAGLAAGYLLAHRGLPLLILDASERIGDAWRKRWDSLRLFSPARWDGLPGKAFPGPGWSYPTGRDVADYLESYAASFDLPVRSGTRVERLTLADDGSGEFIAIAGGTSIRARNVVVATGAFSVPMIPAFAGQLAPAIRQFHSSEYRNPSQLADGPVLVVGVGHSGADIALETARTHRTILSGTPHGQVPIRVLDTWRARLFLPILGFAESHVLTIRTPIGRKMASRSRIAPAPLLRVLRRDLARAGVEQHDARTVGARDGNPVLDDGTVVEVANVIWCTGARPDYSWIEAPVTGDDGWPIEHRGVSPLPGLYFVGVPFQYGVASILIHGAVGDARYVVDRLAERVSATNAEATMEPVAVRS